MAASDPNGLYSTNMDSSSFGCQITRLGSDGSYTYDFSGRPSGLESDWTNRPVNYVSWYDAARYTNWLTTGNTETGVYTLSGATTLDSIMDHQIAAVAYGTAYFIPTEDEWYKAAYYDPSGVYYDYPTGSDTAPTSEGPAGGANLANYYDGGYVLGSPYYRPEVGAYSSSASPYGTFDQGGNVWEWNETDILGNRGVRGGSFGGNVVYLHAGSRFGLDPSGEGDVFGFRVASMTYVPEPGSFVLLGVAGMGMVVRRRRVACQPSALLLFFPLSYARISGRFSCGGGQAEDETVFQSLRRRCFHAEPAPGGHRGDEGKAREGDSRGILCQHGRGTATTA